MVVLEGEPVGTAMGRRTVAIVVPVDALRDLDNVAVILGDLSSRLGGPAAPEVILVVNNYDPDDLPPRIETYRRMGFTVLAIPNTRRPGEVPAFSARMHGVEAASCEPVLLFDADCRVPNPAALVDWYVGQLRDAELAYTYVGFHSLPDGWRALVRTAGHHAARWIKRAILRIPTTRGSNYAVRRTTLLSLYRDGRVREDMHVGPAVKAAGGRIAYSRARPLRVLTSARKHTGTSLRRTLRYFAYRFGYNLRALTATPNRLFAPHTPHEEAMKAGSPAGPRRD